VVLGSPFNANKSPAYSEFIDAKSLPGVEVEEKADVNAVFSDPRAHESFIKINKKH
jgi:hypothetical protein